MINVLVKEYCEGCIYFEPNCTTFFSDNKPNYIITCENANKCRQMYLHVKNEMESKKEKNDE